MPVSLTEALADLAPLIQLAKDVEAGVAALPPEKKPSDYLKLGALILTAVAPLADAIAEQVKN